MRALAIAAILALVPVAASAQVNVTVDDADITLGFMNVFELPANGGGYVFGSAWGLPDLSAVFSAGDILTLGPNTIMDPDPFWYVGGGAPGNPGNKCMEAASYAEVADGSMAGQNVTFSGAVIANTLTSAHAVTAFIRDWDPSFCCFNEQAIPLSALGPFSLSLVITNDPTRIVQYGFRMKGENVWHTDVGPFGTMVIGPDGAVSTESKSIGQVKSNF